MPGIELHADYDRDGRLTESTDERAARSSWPGAIVVANLDRDRRALPSRPSVQARPAPDYDNPVVARRDDEVIPLRIRVAPGALSAGERLRIRCPGVMSTRVRLSTANGIIVPHRLGAPEEYELPQVPPSGVLDLTLQVRTIAGASFGRLSNLDLRYRADQREESRFELTLLRIDVLAVAHAEDHGRFTVSPVILDDRMATATRVYMVDVGYNEPALTDMQRVLNRLSVPLVKVPRNLTGGDMWMQDQYQHAMMQGARRSRQMILHLPRLRRQNSVGSIRENLERFVAGNFRSRNIALFDDLWDRIIAVNTAGGGVLRINFRGIRDWAMGGQRITQVGDQLDRYGKLVDQNWSARGTGSFIDTLAGFPATLRALQTAITAAVGEADNERATLLNGLLTAAHQLVRDASANRSVRGPTSARIYVSQIDGNTVELTEDTALRLFGRAMQMHSSANYGGNVESTPPLPGAPLGKIILGNAQDPDTGGEFMDPDLLRLFAKQKKQPIVELDTTWLKVGHVDEMMAVVPGRSGGFSILHASSAAALAILRAAEAKYRSGLDPLHPNNIAGLRRPSGVLSRLMDEGRHPVTRTMRGKSWYHRHRPPEAGRVSQSNDPPSIYMTLAAALGGGQGFNVHRIGMVPGEGRDRRYPADITPSEILFCERDQAGQSVNVAIDATVLAASRSVLDNEIGLPILPVPVVFDRVASVQAFRDAHHRNTTSAFTPDCANMQIVNGHLCIPKPYGPRMRRDDAIEVVRTAMEAVDVPNSVRARVGPRLIARNRLLNARYWVERVNPAALESASGIIRASYGGLRTVSDIKHAFEDSFPGADDDELDRRLIVPNRRHFTSTGRLRKAHTRIKVNDRMVDLFELWIAAVAEEAGAQLHFVDSWAYHLGEGQIHCGSNVLRRPRRLGRMNAWDAPDHEFRSTVISFDDEHVAAQ